jgi:hypothetical protein
MPFDMEEVERYFQRNWNINRKQLKAHASLSAWLLVTVCLGVFLFHVAYEVFYEDAKDLGGHYDAAVQFLRTTACDGTSAGSNSLVVKRCEEYRKTVRFGRQIPYVMEFALHSIADVTSWQMIAVLAAFMCTYAYMFAQGPLVLYQQQNKERMAKKELQLHFPQSNARLTSPLPEEVQWDQSSSSISVLPDTRYIPYGTSSSYELTSQFSR